MTNNKNTVQTRLINMSNKTKVGHCKKDSINVYIGRYNGSHLLNSDIGKKG